MKYLSVTSILKLSKAAFIITDDLKFYYYRVLKEWQSAEGYLRDTCLSA